MSKISVIYAKSINNVIGVDNKLPWHLPKDLEFFKQTTEGHIVVMGRKTKESLPKAYLPKRYNIVISRSLEANVLDIRSHYYRDRLINITKSNEPMISVVNNVGYILTLKSILEKEKINKDIFIIGGKTLIEQGINDLADQVYQTVIFKDYSGDVLVNDKKLSTDFNVSYIKTNKENIRGEKIRYDFVLHKRKINK